MTETLAAAQQRARFYQQQCEAAEHSLNQWRDYALALGAEYLAELGKAPRQERPHDTDQLPLEL